MHNEYINSLDWMRAFAILSVVLTHYFDFIAQVLLSTIWLSGVHPGVLIFIVLSGFVIHYPHAIKLKKTSNYLIDTKSFITRRFIRVYPP